MDYFTYKQDEFLKTDDGGRKVLSVDIQPEKACIFNCIVCSRGKTKYQCEWHDFGPVEESLQGLRARITADKPDIVKIYGQGDTLTNAHLEEIIQCIHEMGLPVQLVTNCYLLGIGEHMRIACLCEEVIGAFGIVEEEAFRKYHRPLPELGFTAAEQAESIVRFGKAYQGEFTLRIFVSQKFNDNKESAKLIKDILSQVKYDKLWVASTNKLAVSDEIIEKIKQYILD